ncbi:hypothetical protein ACET3Z_011719 [Daucus carota]
MRGINITSLIMIMMAVMVILVSPSHAKDQYLDFDITCFMKCASGCLQNPTLQCFTKCLTSCIAPSPSPSPSPSPMPPMPPKPPMPPQPPATPPTSPVSLPMASLAELKSCNFECAARECASTETEMETLNCMERCFNLSCDDN